MPSSTAVSSTLVREQTDKYQAVRPRYEALAKELKTILERSIKNLAPLAIVQARAKTLSSFAEKVQRRDKLCADPANEFTDLCGARVIVHTRDEVFAVCDFIRTHFLVDEENSQDVCQRLGPAEFGYRSVHYVVQLRSGVFPGVMPAAHKELFPDAGCPMKVEIQVRTLLEHTWADFSHDRSYKGYTDTPAKWERELAGVAAMLEEADDCFLRIDTGLRAYAAAYGAYMTPEEMSDKKELQSLILRYEPDNVEAAVRLAQLAIELKSWDEAVGAVNEFANKAHQPALRERGWARCRKHWQMPMVPEYSQGQDDLEKAVLLQLNDADAAVRLGDTWRNKEYRRPPGSQLRAEERNKAKAGYRKALVADPCHPYALGRFLSHEVADRGNSVPVELMDKAIRQALERCRVQAEVRMNLPLPYCYMGRLHLLRNDSYQSLAAYAKAVQEARDLDDLDEALTDLETELSKVSDKLEAFDWVRRLLLIAQAAKFNEARASASLKKMAKASVRPPVVIVVGGCDPNVEDEMRRYGSLLVEAFRDFKGTVISGGTDAGICGIVGNLQKVYPDLTTVGYLPDSPLPDDAKKDDRYKELHYTDGTGFTPIEPLQNWIDIVSSGIKPADVKVIGINGGHISGAEYRIALALGAAVALVQGSGREAGRLIPDEDWGKAPNLTTLPADGQVLRAFVGAPPSPLTEEERTRIGTQIHEEYLDGKLKGGQSIDRTMRYWNKLPDDLRRSNCAQADHMFVKLHQIRCEAVRVADPKLIVLAKFSEKEVETMAEMEHARWMSERLVEGWKCGKTKDDLKKVSPYLRPWSELEKAIQDWDRDTVRKIPEYLATVGYEVRRSSGASAGTRWAP